MADKIGVITEQGDLGLGFGLLNDKDQKQVSESYSYNKENQKSSDTKKEKN